MDGSSCRRPDAGMVPFSMGTVTVFPVRSSVIVKVSATLEVLPSPCSLDPPFYLLGEPFPTGAHGRESEREVVVRPPGEALLLRSQHGEAGGDDPTGGVRLDHRVDQAALGGDPR